MQPLRQDGAGGSILLPILRLPVAIPAKPGNDGSSKEIHHLFSRYHCALHYPDPMVSALMEKTFDHERDEKHEGNPLSLHVLRSHAPP
jgi:hypothetical protein